MQHQSFTAVSSASRTTLFDYLANVNNLPEWATEFCQEMKTVDGKHRVTSPAGELFIVIRADAGTGVIDMCTWPEGGPESTLPTRVVDLPDGGSAFLLTFFQEPGMGDDVFAQMCAATEREMDNIRNRFT